MPASIHAGRGRVEIPDELLLPARMPRDEAHHVRSHRIGSWVPDQVADDLVAVEGDGAARALRSPLPLEFGAGIGERRQQRLRLAVPLVPLGEERGGAVEVLVVERQEPDHRARTIALVPMSPKTLTGAELQLDDGPARASELFLVDGNNLAYRAFFALPEELATSDGFSTNALLGFTNMLFKLLADYRPRGVAVAWDTRPVHRAELSETYKEGRRPMPDLLREQFPYFRPIVEAFGYRNLEFEGWEADDVIATLATRADEAGVKTCVVSTDRDAFQLCSENVCLMMTPRGVSDVNVYTPDRVEARYGVRPDQVPDFIGLKGDSSDNIPGVPGIGDKTAGQLIAQYGSLEEVIEHVDELSPARRRTSPSTPTRRASRRSWRRCGETSSSTVDPAALVLAPPDRSQLKEMFRRFEFRALLGRVDELDEAVPAAERPSPRRRRALARGAVPELRGRVGYAADADRAAVATGDEVVVSPRPGRLEGELVVHDAKSLRVDAREDTLIAAYLIEPAAPSTSSSTSAPSTGSSSSPSRRPRRRRQPSSAAPSCRAGSRH